MWKTVEVFLLKCTLILIVYTCMAKAEVKEANFKTLRQVQIIFRHGERNPLNSLEQDQAATWPGGWGQLTDVGKKQSYDLGLYFRQRYKDFVSKSFDDKQVYILSSDTERTIKSAMTCTLGFYKEFHENSTWLHEIKVEPIPIRTKEKVSDRIIRNVQHCPLRIKLYNALFDSKYWKELGSPNNKLLEYMKNHTGDTILTDPSQKNLVRVTRFIQIQDNLKIRKIQNRGLPNWAQVLFSNTEFVNVKVRFMMDEVSTVQRKRLVSGPMLEYLLGNMDRIVSGQEDNKKMIFLSGHDITLTSLLSTLDMFEPNLTVGMPGFGSSLLVELHQDDQSLNKGHYIEIWLRNDTNREPYELKVPNCGRPCYLSKFKELTKNLIPLDWMEDCKVEKNDSNFANDFSVSTYFIKLMIASCLTFCFVNQMTF